MGIAGKVNRASHQYIQQNGRIPSTHDLAQLTGIDENTIESARDANSHTTSIDAPLGNDEGDNSMAEMLTSDDSSSNSDSQLDRESMNQFINDLLKEVLNEREQSIIRESFGIGVMEKSLEEIADEMGMTRERIRQVKEKAIRKIKYSPAAKILKEYLG